MNKNIYKFLILSLALLLVITSSGSFIFPDIYSRESGDWQAQSLAQDFFDLFFAVPALLISAFVFLKGYRSAFFMLVGILIFLIYTFIIYTFGVHFNRFFLLYCLTLALSSYTLIYLLWNIGASNVKNWFAESILIRIPLIYLRFFAILFYALWLQDIIPALINNTVPLALQQSGLFTNPVHVIDLSFLLPGFLITAFLLKRRHPLAYVFAPSIMTFSIMMTLSIALLLYYEYSKGYVTDFTVSLVMIFFAVVSLWVFIRFIRNLKNTIIKGDSHEFRE